MKREIPLTRPATLGVLHAGELGTSFARLASELGFRIVSTADQRGPRTRARLKEAPIQVVADVTEVIRASDVVFSFVPPSAAIQAAREFIDRLPANQAPPCFVDMNSISPASMAEIESLCDDRDVELVDGAIHGLAARLRDQGSIYLSGPNACRLAELLAPWPRVQVVGERIGQASLFKMLLGGVSKGLMSLFLELGLAARSAEMLDEFWRELGEFYPGLVTVLSRLAPTYPRHAPRRAGELAELNRALTDLDLRPGLAREAQRLMTLVGQTSVCQPEPYAEYATPSPLEWIEALYPENPLQGQAAVRIAAQPKPTP